MTEYENLTIRKANDTDFNIISTIAKIVICQNYRIFMGSKADDLIYSGDSDRLIKKNINNTYLLINDKKIIGFCIVIENKIKTIMLKFNMQNKGYGSYFINEVSKLIFNDFDKLEIETQEKNAQANYFLEKNNWKLIKKEFNEKENSNENFYEIKK